MRFMDLDLDFFLNKNAYSSGYGDERLGSDYRPWSVSRVRRFLEDRCGLSTGSPIQGRTVKSHDGVLEFWRMLIESGRLKIPFEVVHIDAHPDLWVGDILSRKSDSLYIDLERGFQILERKPVHAGNYLTFAIFYGWIGSLLWVPLCRYWKDIPGRDADEKPGLSLLNKRNCSSSPVRGSTVLAREHRIKFGVLPWPKFRTSETFDYMALSKSPDFTPPESDKLVTIIEGYMKQM